MGAISFRIAGLVTWFAAVLATPAVQAEPTTTPADPRAQAMRERFEEALTADEPSEQLQALRALYRLEPNDRNACALGLIARRAAQWVEAAKLLRQCVRGYAREKPDAKDRAHIATLEGELQMALAMVATLTLKAPLGAQITIDDEPASRGEHYLVPGQHTIEIRQDKQSARQTVTMSQGTARELTLTVPRPPRTEPEKNDGQLVTAGVISASMAALLGGGFTLGYATQRASAEEYKRAALQASQGCFEPWRSPRECSRFTAASTAARNMGNAAIGAVITTGAIGAATVVFAVTRRPNAPTVTVGATSVAVRVRW